MLKENKMNNFDRAEKACYERLKNQNKKTDREIELEKKLEIAVKALEIYANKENWTESSVKLGTDGFGIRSKMVCVPNSYFGEDGYEEAREALAKIKEIK